MLWLILGILIGAAALYLIRHPKLKLAWFDWIIAVLALLLLYAAIENYAGSMSELEPRAAVFLLASFGIPGLILALIVALRVWRSSRQAAV